MCDFIFVPAFKRCYVGGEHFHVGNLRLPYPCLDNAGKKADPDKRVQCGKRRADKAGDNAERMAERNQGTERGKASVPQQPADQQGARSRNAAF